MRQRVLVAMSGGVDSSVAAWMAKEQGFDPVGLFMRTGVSQPQGGHSDRKKGCCSASDAADARRVADMLDIPFHAIDFEADFRGIIDYFADEYLSGRTPNPCIMCNERVKFGNLRDKAASLGASFIATGHYAKVRKEQGRFVISKGEDSWKDQSYVLWGVTQECLSRTIFPVGSYHKTEIRDMAARMGLRSRLLGGHSTHGI